VKAEFRALRRNSLRDAPGDRMIIGDAHDQTALALHQVFHAQIFPFVMPGQ